MRIIVSTPMSSSSCAPYALRAPKEGAVIPQIVFYDKGVGTGGPIDRVRGGALGR